ncbi:MAG: peptidoglycan DD-metalloendopeptidase family protein [Acidimicrobiia bacterium]
MSRTQPPATTTTRPPLLRHRLVRRQGLLAAGLTGLVVTSPTPALADTRSDPSAHELSVDADADPAPLLARWVAEAAGVDAVEHQAPSGALVSAVAPGRAPVARWDGVRVFTDGATTELVGFHESNNPEALPLAATAPIAKSHHHGVAVPTTGEADGQVIVLPTRDRPSGPMTAIDLAVDAGAPVASPVDGEVVSVDVIQYEGTDHKIVIRPDGNPDVLVSIIHVNDPLVQPGDRVRGGETTVAASPRQLHFESQVDRFTTAARGAPAPHVHVELRAA